MKVKLVLMNWNLASRLNEETLCSSFHSGTTFEADLDITEEEADILLEEQKGRNYPKFELIEVRER